MNVGGMFIRRARLFHHAARLVYSNKHVHHYLAYALRRVRVDDHGASGKIKDDTGDIVAYSEAAAISMSVDTVSKAFKDIVKSYNGTKRRGTDSSGAANDDKTRDFSMDFGIGC
jgi:hypothetical protein